MGKKIVFEEMVAALAKDGSEIIKGLSPASAHLLHMIVGLKGEVDELIENVLLTKGKENLIEELGDIEFYFEAVTATIELDATAHNPELEKGKPKVIVGDITTQLLLLSMYTGQALDYVKKHVIYEDALKLQEFAESLMSARGVLNKLYSVYNISREQCITANIAKLGERYSSGKYSNKEAQVRADKKGN